MKRKITNEKGQWIEVEQNYQEGTTMMIIGGPKVNPVPISLDTGDVYTLFHNMFHLTVLEQGRLMDATRAVVDVIQLSNVSPICRAQNTPLREAAARLAFLVQGLFRL